MSNRQITIAIDAMGGEDSPFKSLKGAEIFSKKSPEVLLSLFGDQKLILDSLKRHKINIKNYEIIDCIENVSDNDNTNTILRSRKDSSIYKGLNFVKNHKHPKKKYKVNKCMLNLG